MACLPAGILFFSFLCWVRNEIAATLPPQFRKLFEELRLLDLSWKTWGPFSVLISLLLGSAIHVYIEMAIEPLPGPRHFLSILGILGLLSYILYQLTREQSLKEAFGNPDDSWIHGMWIALIVTPFAIGLVPELLLMKSGHSVGVDTFVFDVVNRGIASFFAIYAIIVSFLKSRTPMAPVLKTPRPKNPPKTL